MKRTLRTLTVTLITATGLSLPAVTHGQGILDGLRGQLQQELRNAARDIRIPGNTPFQPSSSQPPTNQQPRAQSNSIPSETPGQNIDRGFQPGNLFFGPSPQPQPRPQPQPFPSNNPTQTYYPPSQRSNLQPSRQFSGSSQTLEYFPSGSQSGSSMSIYPDPPLKQQTVNNGRIVVRCPKSTRRSIQYKLVVNSSAFEYTMDPGQSQSFTENKVWNIRFTKGSEVVTYRLRGGQEYEFEIGQNGQVELYDVSQVFPDPPKHPE